MQVGSPLKELEQNAVCWNCAQLLVAFPVFCSHCQSIQPPFPVDAFTRLGIAPLFELTPEDLHESYIRLQRQVHPDRFIGRTTQEKQYSLAHSSALNEAYDLLCNPYQRALHLLSLMGLDTAAEMTQTLTDPLLLEEVLEWRERFDEAHNHEQRKALEKEVSTLYKQTLKDLTALFSAQTYEAALAATRRLHYLQKMLQDYSLTVPQEGPLL